MTTKPHDPKTTTPHAGESSVVVDGSVTDDAHTRLAAALQEDAEMAESAEAFSSFVSLVEAEEGRSAAPAAARDRLLRALVSDGRLASFAPQVARLLDVSVDAARAMLDVASGSTAYEPGPFDGVALYHVQGGPAVAGAVTGFVRIMPGREFPEHEHLGEETVLVLQGSVLEPETGRIARSGDVLRAGPGVAHTTVARPGPDLVYLAVLFEGLRVGDDEIRASDPRL